MTAKVSELLYRPSAVPSAYIYMIDDRSWVLHSGTSYWVVDRHHYIPVSPSTPFEAAVELFKHSRSHA